MILSDHKQLLSADIHSSLQAYLLSSQKDERILQELLQFPYKNQIYFQPPSSQILKKDVRFRLRASAHQKPYLLQSLMKQQVYQLRLLLLPLLQLSLHLHLRKSSCEPY